MKNLKMFAIAVMAFAVMATGVHATEAELKDKLGCTSSTCKLTAGKTLDSNDSSDGYVVSDNLIIETATGTANKVVLSETLTIKAGKKLTIKGGNLELKSGAAITIEAGAQLIIKDAPKDVNAEKAAVITHDGASINVLTGGKLSVVDNNQKGFVGYDESSDSANLFAITLTNGDMEVSRNGSNAMNGSTKITATGATITASNNGEGGLNAELHLSSASNIVAKGNGLSGVTIANGSEIGTGCTVEATGNLTKTDDKYIADRSDVSIVGTVALEGTITADTIGNEKVTWDTNRALIGTVRNGEVELKNNAKVDVKTVKALCDTSNAHEGQTITCDADNQKKPDFSGLGVVIEGPTATTYGAAKVSLTSAVTKVIIDDENAQVTVAEGTEVENKTANTIRVFTADGKYVEVESEKTVQIGEPAPVEPTPGEGQTGSEGEGSGNQGPTDNVKNPETNDNILVYAGLGLVSLASVAFTARKRED